jgi:hypothetical protein
MKWDGGIIDVDILLTKSADTLLGTALLREMEPITIFAFA